MEYCTHSELQHLSGHGVGGEGGGPPYLYVRPGCLGLSRYSDTLGPLALAASCAVLRLWCQVHSSLRLFRSWFPPAARFTIWSTSVPLCGQLSSCWHIPPARCMTRVRVFAQPGGSLGLVLLSQLCAIGVSLWVLLYGYKVALSVSDNSQVAGLGIVK